MQTDTRRMGDGPDLPRSNVPAQGAARCPGSGTPPTLAEKVAFLSDGANYPHRPASVTPRETHMSWVFLAGDLVFKLKKPVRYPFLDFSTLARRRHFAEEELRLNRRLAARVYLGLHALTASTAPAGLALDGAGPPVEWLVEMRRLPDALFLDHRIESGTASPADIARVAEVLAGFYQTQPAVEICADAYLARFAAEQAETGRVLADPVFAFDGNRVARILRTAEDALARVEPLMAERVAAGRIVDGHGDLRPEHVCLSDPPVVIDCLEFNPALRRVDPFEEIVLLGLGCARLGADRVLGDMASRISAALADAPPPELLVFHWRYRALLCARLALLHLVEPEPRTPERWRPLAWRYVELAEQAERYLAT